MSSFLATKKQQELLCCGYIRNMGCKSGPLTPDTPILINDLCISFYNENIYMLFQQEKVNKFLSMDNHQFIYSKPIKYKTMSFVCSICPNGWNKTEATKVMFYLEFNHNKNESKCINNNNNNIPNNIKSLTFITKMFCVQTNTEYEITTKKEISSNTRILSKWDPYLLSLAQCQNESELEFICNVNILNIEYKNGKQWNQTGINLNKQSEIVWDIDNNIWRSSYIQRGPSCDNNAWFISLEKGFFGAENKKQLIISLRKWPQCIGGIAARYRIILYYLGGTPKGSVWHRFELNDNDKEGLLRKECVMLDTRKKEDNNNKRFGVFGQRCHGERIFRGYQDERDWSVPNEIKVEIVIEKVFDKDGNDISEDKWKDYGIDNC